MKIHLKSTKPFSITKAVSSGYAKKPTGTKVKDVLFRGSQYQAGALLGVRLNSIRHTINAIGEIDAAMRNQAVTFMESCALKAREDFVTNTQDIKSSQGFHNWRYLFVVGSPPAFTKNRLSGSVFAYFGIRTEDKYYEPRGKGGGSIIEFLNYGTRSGYQIHLKSKSAFKFSWPGGSRTGNPGASVNLPIKGSKTFFGLPPTRDYLIHPGIKPFGFIEKTFQDSLLNLKVKVKQLRSIRFFVGV